MRELVWAADAKRMHDWNLTSNVMSLIYNRTRFGGSESAKKPEDFNPYAREEWRSDLPIPCDISVLKIFLPRNGQHQRTESR